MKQRIQNQLLCLGILSLILGKTVFAQLADDPFYLRRIDQGLDRIGQPVSLKRNQMAAKPDGEFRYRMEYRDDFNFNNSVFEDGAVNLFRIRLGLRIDLNPYVFIYGQGQDSSSAGNSQIYQSPFYVDRLDLHQLYSQVILPTPSRVLSVKVGRQELIYGDQRFVGNNDWNNVGRVFDAVKVMFKPKSWFSLDAWFSQVVGINTEKADSALHNDNFYGIYNTLGPFKEQGLDTFLFIRNTRNNEIPGEYPGQFGQLKEYTLGNRFKGKFKNLDYGIEWAWQFGSRAHNPIVAWAWHNEVGYTFSKLWMQPRLNFEFNHGSGDSNPKDGKYQTFDNLFPTNHWFYGYMDLFSLKNMNDIKIGTDLKLSEKLNFIFGYHWFFLDTANSPWFNAAQLVVRPAKPGASTTVGQELDLLLMWDLSQHLSALIGYSHFHAGAFVRDTGPSDNANFFYVQTKLKF